MPICFCVAVSGTVSVSSRFGPQACLRTRNAAADLEVRRLQTELRWSQEQLGLMQQQRRLELLQRQQLEMGAIQELQLSLTSALVDAARAASALEANVLEGCVARSLAAPRNCAVPLPPFQPAPSPPGGGGVPMLQQRQPYLLQQRQPPLLSAAAGVPQLVPTPPSPVACLLPPTLLHSTSGLDPAFGLW